MFQLITCGTAAITVALLGTLATGCGASRGAFRSNLAGAWSMVEAKETYVYDSSSGCPPEEELYHRKPGEPPMPAVVIKEDGAFDLSHSVYYMLNGLRNTDDRCIPSSSESKPGYVEVVRSRYTPNSSEIDLRFHGSAKKIADSMSFRAKRQLGGTLSYRHVACIGGYQMIVTGKLDRFTGRPPWDVAAEPFNESPAGQIRYMRGHRGYVTSVAYSPNGRHVASGGLDRVIRLWDVETGNEVRRFVGHQGPVSALTFSPDGRFAVSGSRRASVDDERDPYSVRLWEVESGREIRGFNPCEGITSVAFSPDGRLVVAGGYGHWDPLHEYQTNVWIWQAKTGSLVHSLAHRSTTHALSLSPDGRLLACITTTIGSNEGPISLWELETAREVGSFGRGLSLGRYNGVRFSPDGSCLLVSDENGSLQEWNVATRSKVGDFDIEGRSCRQAIYSPDGSRVLSLNVDGFMLLLDSTTGRVLGRFENGADPVHGIAFSPDGRRAVSAGPEGVIRLWQMPE